MSYWKQLLIALCIGTSIGLAVPLATTHLSTVLEQAHASGDIVDIITEFEQQPVYYHFVINDQLLSVVEGKPGETGKVILSGLDVKVWPADLLEMAPQVVFYSLDEVQSYIDTASEKIYEE